MKRRACVIGAGPSGITALKNILDEGIEAVCYDRNDRVGGNWIYSEKPSHSSVFETTHIISSKLLSQYEDYTWEDHGEEVADYPSHQQLASYFQGYAQHFDLLDHIQFETTVKHAERISNDEWKVTIENKDGQHEEVFTDLVVCNGHHWNPRMPEYPGSFDGEFLHSHDFKKAEPFRDKRVLVIGGGNSACDVAVETSRVSKKTSISWRRGYRIIPKFMFGKPSDIVGSGMTWLPVKIRSLLSQLLIRIFIGPNKNYGLQEPDHNFGQTHPVINDELLYRIRHGKVHPKVDIERLDGHTVHFKDGSQEEFDVIIACTGFIISHPFLDDTLINYSDGPVPLYLKMMHPTMDNLFFVGLFQPLGCIWPGAELQAKIIARQLAGKWSRPQNMEKRVEKEVNHPHYNQLNTPRHTITVDYHVFRRQLLNELPKDWVSKERKDLQPA
ncbi:flavin-containing monooxygenase [Ekhidna sp.]|uniref:flavin-containing monooxygenase n=1 Tax=Ekhidna sp. TaxID=2608089 RepID=UPI003B59D581